MGIYSKNLSGQKAAVFVGPASVEYTTDATFAAFIANAVEGEIGVFLEDGSLKSDALAAGDVFFIAQMKDGEISKTPLIAYNDVYSKRKTAYDAPAKKVMTVGYNGTSGSLGLDFTGASSSNPIDVGIAVRETTPGNQPFPVQEAYTTVKSSSADEYTVVAALVSQLNFDVDYEKTSPDAFVKAEVTSNGAITELLQNLTVVKGSKIITAAASITIATGAFVSIRDSVYKVASGGTGTSFTLDRPYQGDSETIAVGSTVDQAGTIAYTSGTTELGIRLTGLRNEVHFVVTPYDNIADATVTTITEWKQGAGSGESIVELEKEGRFFAGVGSVINEAFADDYGLPSLFASSSVTYDQYFIDAFAGPLPSAGLPVSQGKSISRIHIAVPSSGTSPTGELTTILGL